MKVTIKFFARLRDLVGTKLLTRDVADNSTIAELIDNLQTEFPQLAGLLPSTAIALNQEFADPQTRLNEGDEVALFPPVSGGTGETKEFNKFAVTFDPITLDEIATQVVTHLEYEAYQEMAVTKLRQIADEAYKQWPDIVDMAIVQRIGRLEIGETAVVVAVSSSHRNDGCFEACAYAINRLKEIVPIWKKEVGPDGAEWIEGDYLPSTSDAKTP
jgi:molybdopterin synthase catalytic subunit